VTSGTANQCQGDLGYGLVDECADWYVDLSATGANNGTSWADAFTNIQLAVITALPGDYIFVAGGAYQSISTGSVLSMKDGVFIFGGMAGTEQTVGDRPDPWANPSVLSGNSLSYHVVTGASNAILDGFYITGGVAGSTATEANSQGGGIYINGGSMTISNCIVDGNNARTEGGGLYNGGGADTQIINCLFINNTAADGGGIFSEGALFNTATPALSNCTIADNTASSGGGGYYNSLLTAGTSIIDSIIYDNFALQGTEIQNDSLTPPSITYSAVRGGYTGTGNLSSPFSARFTTGSYGDYYLEHVAAGQSLTSPCVNAGSGSAKEAGMNNYTTRTDGVLDSGTVDMGFHFAR